MEFHDPTFGIGKFFGQESTVVNFGSLSGESSSKIGRYFNNKVVLKLKSAKNAFYKKGAPKLIFFNANF